MPTVFKLLLFTLVLNVIRYFPVGWLEMWLIARPMHAPMESQAACFGFTSADLWSSYVYNYLLWFWVVVIFHISHRQFSGSRILKSLQVFGICCFFFCSLAAIYMNHFNAEIRTFFRWSMLDALLLFTLLGVANGLLYPLFFKPKSCV